MLLAPIVTALQILLEVCRAYAGPHDVVYNTTKTVCMLVGPKQSQGQFSTRVKLGNEELSFVEEFRYLGHIMTADCGDDKDFKKQFRRQNAVAICWSGNSHLHLLRQKSNCSSRIVTKFMDVLFGVIHSRTILESLLSVIVTHSSVLLMSPDTPARVWHLRPMELTIYQCGVPQIWIQLDEQSNSFPNSIVTAIVNSEAYHQSPLMNKWESMLYV